MKYVKTVRHDGGVLKPAVLERQRKSKGVPRGEA